MPEDPNIPDEQSALDNPRSENVNENISPEQSIEQPQTQNMEVHHHPDLHHKPKKWKEYFLEFLMIFLAVTMGFFAESIRESIADNAKENEFIQSMIEDAGTDTANIHAAIILNEKRVLYLDSLTTLCFNYSGSQTDDSKIYLFYRIALVHPTLVSPTERTLLQLKNSGGMRLIRKRAAVDSIIAYDDMAKKLADQLIYYERYQNESVTSAMGLLNFKYYGNWKVYDFDSAQLLSHDKTKLIEFGNRIVLYSGVVKFYIERLKEMNAHAIGLIKILKEKYHLENE